MKHPSKRQRRRILAERLLDGIGGIDDVYLEESRTFRPEVVRHSRKRWIAIPVTVLSAWLILAGIRHVYFRPSVSVPEPLPVTCVQEADRLLETVIKDGHFTVCSGQELTFRMPGGASASRLVIAERATGQLYVSRPFRPDETIRLEADLTSGGRVLPPDEPSSAYAVWVLFGDGRVISPDLRASAGNTGFDQLFPYASEQLASPSFYEFLNRLVQDGS